MKILTGRIQIWGSRMQIWNPWNANLELQNAKSEYATIDIRLLHSAIFEIGILRIPDLFFGLSL